MIASQKATASAKAASIINNIEACKKAAALYYIDHYDDGDMSSITAAAFLNDSSEYVPNWEDFSSGGIKYAPTEDPGYQWWALDVDFGGDADAKDIATALSKAKGYNELTDKAIGVIVVLSTGELQGWSFQN